MRWVGRVLILNVIVTLMTACGVGHLRQWTTAPSPRLTLKQPRGVAVDSHGSIYVADTHHDRILKLSPRGRLLGVWGRAGQGLPRRVDQMRRWSVQLREPRDVSVDAKGTMYISDIGNGRVQKMSPAGRFLASWPCPNAIWVPVHPGRPGNGSRKLFPCSGYVGGPYFWAPSAIAASTRGDVYVLDDGYGRIDQFDIQGTPKGAYQPVGGQDGVRDMAVDRRGNLFVLSGTRTSPRPGKIVYRTWIIILSRDGKTLHRWVLPRGAEEADAVALGAHDTVYLLATDRRTVYAFSSRGRRLRSWSLPAAPQRETVPRLELLWPGGIASDGRGKVYVTDAIGDRLYKYTTGGKREATWRYFRR